MQMSRIGARFGRRRGKAGTAVPHFPSVSCAAAALSAEAADAHRVDDVADGAHASGVAVGYFGAERLLDRHHDPDGVELVGAEIVD
jgi:hypothetical protein